MLEINTNSLSSRKKVLIDGNEYTVRKLGAGEELSLSQAMRELNKLSKKESEGELTDEEQEKVTELAQNTLNILVGTFDDGGDGSKAKQLVSRLSAEELREVYNRIFNEPEDTIAEVS